MLPTLRNPTRCANAQRHVAVSGATTEWRDGSAPAMSSHSQFARPTTHQTGTRMPEATHIPPELQQARHRIRQYILENLMFSDDPSQLPDDVSLLDRGIIDSTGVLEVVMFIEEAFGMKVRDSDLLPENFDSVARIADFVARLRAA